MICEAIRTRPKQMGTRLGTFGEVSYTLAPRASTSSPPPTACSPTRPRARGTDRGARLVRADCDGDSDEGRSLVADAAAPRSRCGA